MVPCVWGWHGDAIFGGVGVVLTKFVVCACISDRKFAFQLIISFDSLELTTTQQYLPNSRKSKRWQWWWLSEQLGKVRRCNKVEYGHTISNEYFYYPLTGNFWFGIGLLWCFCYRFQVWQGNCIIITIIIIITIMMMFRSGQCVRGGRLQRHSHRLKATKTWAMNLSIHQLDGILIVWRSLAGDDAFDTARNITSIVANHQWATYPTTTTTTTTIIQMSHHIIPTIGSICLCYILSMI